MGQQMCCAADQMPEYKQPKTLNNKENKKSKYI